MDEIELKRKTRRILTGMFLLVAGLTIGIIVIAVLIGMWIGQKTGGQSFLNWLPLFISLPINLWISSFLGKRAVAQVTALKYGQKMENEPESQD